jgi:Asp-tRNA(Asn)/Glu-tRNA(Gln) amidotransferase A subunit family amidase
MPWRKVDSLFAGGKKTLVVGVMMEDGVVRPTTPVRRALGHWVDKLARAKGVRVELRRWEPRDLHRRAWDMIRSLYFMESGKYFHLLSRATGEPLLPLTQFILAEPFVRSAEADLAANTAGEARKQDEMSASEVMASVRMREAFRAEYLRAWNELGLDCLLCPATANVAPRPSTVKYWNYTSVFNLVDYPGVVFPSGIVADSALDREFEKQPPKAVDGFEYDTRMEGEWMGEFDEDNTREYEQHRDVFNGAPVGLQLIGRRYKDEELVKYAELLDHIVRS